MRIVLTRTLIGEDIGEHGCAICKSKLWLGPVSALAISDGDVLLGETCPAYLERGPQYMQHELEWRAYWSRLIAAQDEELALEGFEKTPSLDEYLMLEKLYKEARYPSYKELERAEEAGEVVDLLDEDEGH
jgi:hypothetical protein